MKTINVTIASADDEIETEDEVKTSTISLSAICNELDRTIVKLRAYAAVNKDEVSQKQIDAALAAYGNSKGQGKFEDFIEGIY